MTDKPKKYFLFDNNYNFIFETTSANVRMFVLTSHDNKMYFLHDKQWWHWKM